MSIGVMITAVITTLVRFWAFCDRRGLKFWLLAMSILTFIYKGFSMVGELTVTAFQKLADVVSAGSGMTAPCGEGLQQYLAIGNTFFPLDEMLQMMASLVIGIWIPVALYRFVKSWIPTLSGSG